MNDRTSFDVATRVLAGDDGTTYDRVAIALHWTTALLVLVQFVNAVTWDYWSKPARENLQSIHVSLGLLLAAVIVARLIWRWMPGHQVSSLGTGWVRTLSKAGQTVSPGIRRSARNPGDSWPEPCPSTVRIVM